jgi:hypothetical protein
MYWFDLPANVCVEGIFIISPIEAESAEVLQTHLTNNRLHVASFEQYFTEKKVRSNSGFLITVFSS